MKNIYFAFPVSFVLLMSFGIFAQEDEELMMRPNPDDSHSQERQQFQTNTTETDSAVPVAIDGKEKMGIIIEDKPPVTKSPSNLKDGRETMGIVIEERPPQDMQQ